MTGKLEVVSTTLHCKESINQQLLQYVYVPRLHDETITPDHTSPQTESKNDQQQIFLFGCFFFILNAWLESTVY